MATEAAITNNVNPTTTYIIFSPCKTKQPAPSELRLLLLLQYNLSYYTFLIGSAGESRTRTHISAADFESAVSTIPPPRHNW